ncbi:RTC4-like domain-containing protein [Pilobolus umbonatus]|nr:RTC4-like domain-containing protein [Pilobolus umbonatus]
MSKDTHRLGISKVKDIFDSSSLPTIPNKRSKQSRSTIHIPKRVKRTTCSTTANNNIKEQDLKELLETELDKTPVFECPDCFEVLNPPYPPKIQKMINALKEDEKRYLEHQQKVQKHEESLNEQESVFQQPVLIQKKYASMNDRKIFCRMHRKYLVMLPLGKQRGYPRHIDFDRLHLRIKKFESELKDIIDGKLPSVFLNELQNTIKEIGLMKVRETNQMMLRFTQSVPGYYGLKGSDKMMEVLNVLLLDTNYITKEKIKPLSPTEYIQQILVPECGWRLIQEDLKEQGKPCTKEDALAVMKESMDYGALVNFQAKSYE